MGRVRFVLVALAATVATLGVPQHAGAAPIPRALDATLRVVDHIPAGATVARSIPLRWRANLAGVSMAAGAAAGQVEVAVRGIDAGGPNPWQPLQVELDEAPDGRERRAAVARAFSQPAWVGTASALDIRIRAGDAAVRDVRVHVTNTLGDARPAGPVLRVARAVRNVLLSAATRPADAATSRPSIVSRRQWGADERLRRCCPVYADSVRMVFVHHTANSNSYSYSQGPALVRAIYRYHTVSRRWSDIGYNFLIDRYGRIYEGRYGGISRAVVGAHTLGFNARSTSVAFIGTFSAARPTSAMLRSGVRLLAWKMDAHHIPPTGRVSMVSSGNDRYPRGTVVAFNRISGHRDAKSTSCPGAYLYEKLPSIRYGVNRIGHPKIYIHSLPPTIVRPDGDGVADIGRFGARFSRTVSWRLSILDARGRVRRSWRGTGTWMRANWNGTTSEGALVPTGRYTYLFSAKHSSGALAVPARGFMSVVTTHLPGTALLDSSGRYTLSQGGQRQDAADGIAYYSHYFSRAPVSTGPSERSRYAAAQPLQLREGTLLTSEPDGGRYIWSGGVLRRFPTVGGDSVLLDYPDDAFVRAPATYVATLPKGSEVDDGPTHPPGSIVRDPDDKSLYVIGSETKRPISPLAQRSLYRAVEIVSATPGDLALDDASPIAPRTGTLVAASDGGPPYVLIRGAKRRFVGWSLFSAMGYTSSMLVHASAAELESLPTGPLIR